MTTILKAKSEDRGSYRSSWQSTEEAYVQQMPTFNKCVDLILLPAVITNGTS